LPAHVDVAEPDEILKAVIEFAKAVVVRDILSYRAPEILLRPQTSDDSSLLIDAIRPKFLR
jgi:hypothetical protein